MDEVVFGVNKYRLEPEQNNPREVAFFETWSSYYKDLLGHLFVLPAKPEEEGAFKPMNTPIFGPSHVRLPIGNPTERDRIVAATVIQWLGSNVGFAFLNESLKKAGYKIEKV